MLDTKSFRTNVFLPYSILLILLLSSCGTPKLLKEQFANDDVIGLVQNYDNQKPKYQKKIVNHIFSNHDFSKDSYGDLIAFQNSSRSADLETRFSDVIKIREDSILSVLDQFKSVRSIASYYKEHADEQSFLCPIVAGTLTQNIQEYEYPDVRTIYREFKNTNIRDSIYPYYAEKRAEALPLAMSKVDKYCQSEVKLLSIYKSEGRERIPQVASTAFEHLIDQLLDYDFPQDQKQLVGLYNKITTRHNPISGIKDVVKDETQKMVKDINGCRKDMVKDLLDPSSTNRYMLPTLPISVKKETVKFPANDFKAIANVYKKPTPHGKINTLLSIASWIPGYIGTAATLADLYKTYKDTKNQANEVAPYIKRMATSVYKNFESTCCQEYDESFENIKKSVLKSQEKLKQAIYEDF